MRLYRVAAAAAASASALLLLPLPTHGINIISSNDDGWAEINIRTLYEALSAEGHDVVVSAPAQNESGTGSLDANPTPLTTPCEYNSCPAGSPAEGFNASDPKLNYVNSYPVTSIKYGITVLAPKLFADGSPPGLAVTGPNVGSNLGLATLFSGTVGAATYAASSKANIPAIAFSGSTGTQTAWNVAGGAPAYSEVYADLAANFTNSLIASGLPYLPQGIWLNVNFPAVSDTSCSSLDEFDFVLSRIHTAVPFITPDDVDTCGSTRLPTETDVVGTTSGCYVSVSVGDASNKMDANATSQEVVLKKLGGLLTCLPSS